MNDDILDVLVAHGVPGATIVRVAKLIADAEQTRERRTKNTERMRAVRTHAHTHAHTETQEPALSLSKKDLSIEESKKEKKKGVRGKQPKTTLPADWQPIGNQRDPTEADEFRDHARAKGYQYSDWHAAYRNFQRSPYNARNKNGAQQSAADLAAGQAEWECYRQEQIRKQLNGKKHEAGIRQNTGVGQAGSADQGELRPESGRTHGKTIECRQIVDAISAVARHLRN